MHLRFEVRGPTKPQPLVEPGLSQVPGSGETGKFHGTRPEKSGSPEFLTKTAENVIICLDRFFFSFFKCLAFLPSNQSEWPCWQRVLVTNSQCRPRYQYRAKQLKSRLPYAKNKFSKRCQISNGSKMATVSFNQCSQSEPMGLLVLPEPLIPHFVNLSIHVTFLHQKGQAVPDPQTCRIIQLYSNI